MVVEYLKNNLIISLVAAALLGSTTSYYATLHYGCEVKEKAVQTVVQNVGAFQNEPSEFVVDVSGAVAFPGMYKITQGSRVGDALREAGGISSEASLSFVVENLNLASKLNDGDKVLIPFEWEVAVEKNVSILPLVSPDSKSTSPNVAVSSSGGSNSLSSGTGSGSATGSAANNIVSEGLVNVNQASLQELDALSGIGPSYAQRIIDGRPYSNYDDLVSKSKVSKTTLDKIKEEISF